MSERIPNEELVIGGIYKIVARNFSYGVFTGEGFVGSREKFGDVYLFEEYLQEMPGEERRAFGTACGIQRIARSGDQRSRITIYEGMVGAVVDPVKTEDYFQLPQEIIPAIKFPHKHESSLWLPTLAFLTVLEETTR